VFSSVPFRELHFLPAGREHRAATSCAADCRTLRRAACAANDAANHCANAGTTADLRGILALGRFTLEGQCVRAERIALTIHLYFGEAEHQARTTLHATRALDFGHIPMQRRAGGHNREAIDDDRLTQARGHRRFRPLPFQSRAA
jgi:hypothetical protein